MILKSPAAQTPSSFCTCWLLAFLRFLFRLLTLLAAAAQVSFSLSLSFPFGNPCFPRILFLCFILFFSFLNSYTWVKYDAEPWAS